MGDQDLPAGQRGAALRGIQIVRRLGMDPAAQGDSTVQRADFDVPADDLGGADALVDADRAIDVAVADLLVVRFFGTETGVLGALIAWTIAGTGMLMLAFVFQNLALRKPDLDSGVFIYAKAGFGDYAGFNPAIGFWASTVPGNAFYWVFITGTLGASLDGFGDGGGEAWVHSCAPRTPWSLVAGTGVHGLSADLDMLGAAFGLWLDQHHPGARSWTLALLAAGLAVGCLNAWRWVAKEEAAMRQEQEDDGE